MTITEFLLARIAEDEAAANSAANLTNGGRWWVDPNASVSGKHWIYDVGEKFTDRPVADYIACHDPSRVLAECAAKRRIINHHEYDHIDEAHLCQDSMVDDDQCDELRALASVYANRPGYDPAWSL